MSTTIAMSMARAIPIGTMYHQSSLGFLIVLSRSLMQRSPHGPLPVVAMPDGLMHATGVGEQCPVEVSVGHGLTEPSAPPVAGMLTGHG